MNRLCLASALFATLAIGGPATTTNPYLPSPLETRVLGPSQFLAGSRASLRVVTINHADDRPIRNASVNIALASLDKAGNPTAPRTLFDGKTNQRGTVDASFDMPKLPKGNYQFKVTTAARDVGDDTVTQNVQLIERAQILLTTDKPLYQPSQIIHIRALALAKPNNKPVADQPLTLEVEDAKGNKIFKETKNTSKFGVVGLDFTLGNEIGLGRYTVRAIVGDNREEKKVTVERYVLPKFKVVATTDKKFYQPGETLSGKVQCDYFFGKPVAGEVTIKVSTFDVETRQIAELKGKLDAGGAWKFETKLPEHLVGQPVNQGSATVTLEVEVKDKADHKEKNSLSVPVSKDTIRITVVPESGRVIPQVENKFYVLTSLPDGTPVPCRIVWKGAGYEFSGKTDAMGVAEVPLTPKGTLGSKPAAGGAVGGGIAGRRIRAGGVFPVAQAAVGDDEAETESLQFSVAARDEKGNTGYSEQNIPFAQKEETILVRTSKSVAKVGDDIAVTVVAARPTGTAYLDLIRDGQTLLTKSLDFAGGKGETKVALDNGMAGTLVLNAYLITTKGEIVRDNKVVFVSAANDLKLSIKPDRETYQPGGKAKIQVAVTDRSNRPIAAAMGINIVDESVFALQEMQPGMERIYFTLERELLKPRYEIHEFEMNEVLSPTPLPRFGEGARGRGEGAEPELTPAIRQQKAARILFAASAPRVTPAINVNTYTSKLEAVMGKWNEATQRDGKAIWLAAKKYFDKHNAWVNDKEVVTLLLRENLISEKALSDPLGTPYRLSTKLFGLTDLRSGFVLTAAGPDRKFETSDDVNTMVYQGGGTQTMGNGRDEMFFGGNVRFARGRAGGMGGGFGGAAEGAVMAFGAPPAPARMLALAKESDAAKSDSKPAASGDEAAVRIRQFFPETLLSLANLITDDRGHATIDVTMADSITTWRLSALGSSQNGDLGSTTAPLRVFQDFFVDIDLPVSLTQNDEVSIPVAIYNYLAEEQKIRLVMEKGDWFDADIPPNARMTDALAREVTLGKGEVSVVYFPIKVRGIGNHMLTVTARGSSVGRASSPTDAIKRSIEVRPDGMEIWQNVNDRLEPGTVDKTITIPQQAIDGASNILVRVYPGGFSQVVDGLDKILRMPYG